ncbi:NUDIX hydrolase [Corynebacterium sanguinis]|uniref:NUDIX domain-containing protein n=1 Tax=Corynebacterium sanguinis TaxID=2594913 RepID=UPI001184773C|nr:NUDIX hydrolase [Corynebacterium sanguinis]MCT1411238.1 NUDIX hydrolase [Corynebacterium sanguinis]MCT1415093.1 NUDIX hydrolase [Corynebacterium sanguinis]MCT1444675.1 NUDIX hydrolase [Corynebacterium sanguinis]MCT1464102.1 NUDIX hydrolase [Corynebacterium sanguinis]MCT1492769.1 NUDIX hydrolase [Corynebacterium sanguinis]
MPHNFTVTHSELLVDAPILALRRDTVTMPGGGDAKREIVEHLGAVAVVALDEGNRIALVTQYRHSVKRRLQELPAGILDVAGESELDCAKRELYEEAGLEASDWSVLVDLVTSPGFAEEAVRVFCARDLTVVDRPDAEDEEADMTLEWVALDEARSRVFAGEITNAIAVAGVLAAAAVADGVASPRSTAEPFDLRPTSMAERRKANGSDLKKPS